MKRTDEAASTRAARPLLAPYARLLAWTIGATIAIAAAAQGVTTYSGSAVSSYGTINGWGVTDAYAGGMLHTSYVSTTLRSPTGRTSSSGWRSSINSVRADVSLGWDGTDLGTYTESSDHKFYCNVIHAFVVLGATQGSTTAPYVTLRLRNSDSDSVSQDNHAWQAYNQWNGTIALGTYKATTDGYWQTGVEIVGTVLPSTYTGLIILQRQRLGQNEYNNSTTAYPTFPPCPGNPTCDDTSNFIFRDDDPQSDGSNGKVYDLDTPGLPPLSTDDVYYRLRVNFREYAVAQGVPGQVSTNLYWWSRISVQRTSGQTDLRTDVPGDNTSGTGTTKLSWDLQ